MKMMVVLNLMHTFIQDTIVDLHMDRPPPDEVDVLGYYFDQNALDWMQSVPKYVCQEPFSERIVKTVTTDSSRTTFTLH